MGRQVSGQFEFCWRFARQWKRPAPRFLTEPVRRLGNNYRPGNAGHFELNPSISNEQLHIRSPVVTAQNNIDCRTSLSAGRKHVPDCWNLLRVSLKRGDEQEQHSEH